MNNILWAIVLFVFSTGCKTKNKILDDRKLEFVIVETNYRDSINMSKRKISQTDSLTTIVQQFNNAKKQPIKFFPKYKINLIYSGNTELVIFATDSVIKYNGLTYKLNESIRQIVGD